MSLSIRTSRFSFYSFDTEDRFSGCGFESFGMCLPVFASSDVAFQFLIVADSKPEADLLCDLTNDHIEVGLVNNCTDDGFLLLFSQKTVRYRKNDNTLLYNWNWGLPGFEAVIPIGGCFHIKIRVNGVDVFCSNCLLRIGEDCYTAVMDYNNNDDAFDFDYCGGTLIGESDDTTCEPLFVTFSSLLTLSIPYTASLQSKYGLIPTVVAWIRNLAGELVDAGIEIKFDTMPPSLIEFDFGGTASGVIKIS